MTEPIRKEFDRIKASPALKENTRAFLQARRGRRRPARAVGWAAAAICAIFLMAVGVFRFLSAPVSYVSIDVNPSLELSLNRMDRIVSAAAYNNDGAKLLQEIPLEGKTYTEAIGLLLSSEAMRPYLSGASGLTFTVAAADKGKEADLLKGVESSAGYRENGALICRADVDVLDEAHGHGLSFGKYAAYLTLSQYDEDCTPEDCRDMTMAELHQRIHACQREHAGGGLHHGESTAPSKAAPSPSAGTSSAGSNPSPTPQGGGSRHRHGAGHHGMS